MCALHLHTLIRDICGSRTGLMIARVPVRFQELAGLSALELGTLTLTAL